VRGNEFIKQGDLSVIEEVLDRYAGSIERFAIQYGCTQEQAGDLTQETFRSLYSNLSHQTDVERIRITLYQIALEKLNRIQLTMPSVEAFLPFEEDRQLHGKIINLEVTLKISLILSRFHDIDDTEIAKLVGIPTEAVKEAINHAVYQLVEGSDHLRLAKQLEFLNMSYGRIRTSFRKEQVFMEEEKEIRATVKTRKPLKGMLPWVVGILILLSLIATSVVTSEEYQKTAAEKYRERLKESFENEMSTRFAELGMAESTENDSPEWNLISYGKEARFEFQQLLRRYDNELKDTGTVDRKNIKEQYNAIIETLALPSEMVERLAKNPLSDHKDKSEDFMKAYLERYYEFQQAYQILLSDYPETIDWAIVDGKIDLEKFLDDRATYPKALQKGLEGMMKQNIYPTVIPHWNTIIPIFQKNEIGEQMRALLHEDLSGYVTLLESPPFVIYPGSAYSFDEAVEYMLDMEKTLLVSQLDENETVPLFHAYTELLLELIGGLEPERLVGRDGKVKVEVQSAWKKIASNKELTPSAVILKEIIREMEVDDWTASEDRKRLTMHHISNAVTLARDGQLQNFELTGIIPSTDYLDVVSLPDAQFKRQVEKTYELFSAEHDRAVLQDVHPLVVFCMFVVANDREDLETMWHLRKPDESQTFEDYVNGWEKENIDLSQINNLLFHKSGSRGGSVGVERRKAGPICCECLNLEHCHFHFGGYCHFPRGICAGAITRRRTRTYFRHSACYFQSNPFRQRVHDHFLHPNAFRDTYLIDCDA